MLGVMIAVHEAGHFFAARICKISVKEFALGMGPVIYSKTPVQKNGEPGTRFSLRLFPIGGFCDMTEDEESDSPSHFRNKPLLSRIFVLVSGAIMNMILGLLIAIIIFFIIIGNSVVTTEITGFSDGFPYGDKFMAGDVIVNVNGEAIYSRNDLNLFFGRDTDKPYTITVKRGNEKIVISGIEKTLTASDDSKIFGFFFHGSEKITFFTAIKHGFYTAVDYVRLVRLSLGDLISGRAKASEMMGPVGMGGAINQIVSQESTEEEPVDWLDKFLNVLNLAALIAVNLAVFNLLPIPALDGGRILLALFSAFLLKVRKRPLSAKVEGAIHGSIFFLLIALMVFVFFNDIRRLIGF